MDRAQLERVRHMQSLMEKAAPVVASLREDLEAYWKIMDDLAELETYYRSGQWKEDTASANPDKTEFDMLSQETLEKFSEKRRRVMWYGAEIFR